MKQLLFTKGPQGPIGATLGTAMNNFCSSSNKVSTHYITWLFSFWIWRRRCLKFAWFWPFGALPLGPHGGHTYYLNNFESPTPKDDSCQVWLKSNHAFSRRRWKCKKFTDDGRRTTDDARRTTHDARRTTDDGRKRTAIAHSSLRLRWANKQKPTWTLDLLCTNIKGESLHPTSLNLPSLAKPVYHSAHMYNAYRYMYRAYTSSSTYRGYWHWQLGITALHSLGWWRASYRPMNRPSFVKSTLLLNILGEVSFKFYDHCPHT